MKPTQVWPRLIGAFLVLLLTLTVAPTPSQAASSAKFTVCKTEALNVRSGPGLGFAVKTTIPRGFLVTGTAMDSHWLRVDSGTYAGRYVSLRFLCQHTVVPAARNVQASPSKSDPYLMSARKLVASHCPAGSNILVSSGPSWATANFYNRTSAGLPALTIRINPGLSSSKLKYVVVHECAHLMQSAAFGYQPTLMIDRLNEVLGRPSSSKRYESIERLADCMAHQRGATMSVYARKCSAVERRVASMLWAGLRP